MHTRTCACSCLRVHVHVHACVRACVRAGAYVSARAVWTLGLPVSCVDEWALLSIVRGVLTVVRCQLSPLLGVTLRLAQRAGEPNQSYSTANPQKRKRQTCKWRLGL